MATIRICLLLLSMQSAFGVGVYSRTCAATFEEVMTKFKGSHPFHEAFAAGGYEIAVSLSDWVRDVIGVNESTHPTMFSYYSNIGDTTQPCLTAKSRPYVTGGTPPLCDALEWYSGSHNKTLSLYFTTLLDLGCTSRGHGCESTNATTDWNSRKQLIKNFGFTPYEAFLSNISNTCPSQPPTSVVFNPKGGCLTVPELAQHNQVSEDKYYGLSGGGGSGAGFEIFCQNIHTKQEEIIISGGGGGGGGINTPEECVGIASGGGGGGGVQVGPNGEPRVGGGCGNSFPNHIDTQPDVNPTLFSMQLKTVKNLLQTCHNSSETTVVLRGGGGGGVGFEAYSRWNVSNCTLQPVELPSALSVGYGFQFSLGTKLTPNGGISESEYVVCPNNPKECSTTCIGDSQLSDSNWEGIGTIFKCADLLSQRVCRKAKTKDGRSYGKYAHYTSCNCPIARLFKNKYLPDTPQWEYDRNGTCVYPPDPNEPTPAPGDVFPELSKQDLIDNPQWCPLLWGCPPLPGCEP
eukprot:TRINITY_DN34494_c0_g1_i1.p1 TRINITY_DN34494_c0_g1~~TRINITY_DN34494_c0_g1_i1.p1  ORF type:complete len:517 (+),score=82.98 TRINITY_DN34494_c0_g1_i1:66-1616(+)